jgi:hypothetical protein
MISKKRTDMDLLVENSVEIGGELYHANEEKGCFEKIERLELFLIWISVICATSFGLTLYLFLRHISG